MPALATVVTLLIFGLIHAGILAYVYGKLPRYGKRLYVTFTLAYVILMTLHIVLNEAQLLPSPLEVRTYFSITNSEYQPSAVYSSLMFASVGFAAFMMARFAQPRTLRYVVFWAAVGLLFVGFGLDEYFELHESTEDLWIPLYIALCGAYVVATVALLFRRAVEDRLPAILLRTA